MIKTQQEYFSLTNLTSRVLGKMLGSGFSVKTLDMSLVMLALPGTTMTIAGIVRYQI